MDYGLMRTPIEPFVAQSLSGKIGLLTLCDSEIAFVEFSFLSNTQIAIVPLLLQFKLLALLDVFIHIAEINSY